MSSVIRFLVPFVLISVAIGIANAGLGALWTDVSQGDMTAALHKVLAPIAEPIDAALDAAAPEVEHGVAAVDTLIGDAFYYGHGVSRDYVEANRWYRTAAAEGSTLAQSNLGDIYYYGRGVPQDYAEATRWWQMAADGGVAAAQLNLSVMYANGDGIAQDYVKAHMYANLASVYLPPGEDRASAIKNRDIVAKLMTRDQIAEAQRLARAWHPKSP